MRYATTPAWVFVMLIVMGIGFIAGSVPFWLFVPVSGHFVAVIWVLMGAGFVLFSVRALRGRRDDDRIRRDGIRATATVLAANMTGWVVNNVPQWALKLRIEGVAAPYETTMKLLTFNPPANGASFSVRVDPSRRDHIVMAGDSDDAVTASSGAAAASSGAAASNATDVGTAVTDALRRAGFLDGAATTTVNPDGSRTITSTSVTTGGVPDAAETVKLLAELERMHANGTLGDAEFDALKQKLLGEA